MEASYEEVARDLVVAWITHGSNKPSFSADVKGEQAGAYLAGLYKVVCRGVLEEQRTGGR